MVSSVGHLLADEPHLPTSGGGIGIQKQVDVVFSGIGFVGAVIDPADHLPSNLDARQPAGLGKKGVAGIPVDEFHFQPVGARIPDLQFIGGGVGGVYPKGKGRRPPLRHASGVVGFALETDNELANAQSKLEKKNFDLIVLNSLQDKGAGFHFDTNKITILGKDNKIRKFELKSKPAVAEDILDEIEALWNGQS